MAHFSLIVVGTTADRLDEVLDPFMAVPKDKKYTRFEVMDAQIRKEFDAAQDPRYKTLEAFVEVQHAGVTRNEEGLFGRWNNPNSKLSYYVVGGRNTGFFQLCKDGVGELRSSKSCFDPIPGPNTADITTFKCWDQGLQSKIEYERAVERHRYFFAQLGDTRLPVSAEDWHKFFQLDSPLQGYDLESLYTRTEDEYASLSALRANVSYAVLKDGVLYERSYGGGQSGTTKEIEEFYRWAEIFENLFKGMDPNTPVIAITAYE